VLDFTYEALIREFEQIVRAMHDIKAQVARLREEVSA